MKKRIIYFNFLINSIIIFISISILFVSSLPAQIQSFYMPLNSIDFTKIFTPPAPIPTEENNFGYYPLGGEDHTVEYLLKDTTGSPDRDIATLSNKGIINEKDGYSSIVVGNFKFIYTESKVSKDSTTPEHVQKFIEYFIKAKEEIEVKKGYLVSGIGSYRDEIIHIVIKNITPYEGKVEYCILDKESRDYTSSEPVIIVDNDYAHTLNNGDNNNVSGAMKAAAARELFHVVQYRYIEDYEHLRLLADLPKVADDVSFLRSRGITISNALSNIERINNRLKQQTQSGNMVHDSLPAVLLHVLHEYNDVYGALLDLKADLRGIVEALSSNDPTIQCLLSDYCYVPPINPEVSLLFFAISNIKKYVSYCSDTIEEYQWWLESMALWMEDEIYDEVNKYAYFLKAWIEHPERGVDYDKDLNFSYGNILLIKYLAQNYGEEIIRFIWDLSVRPIVYVDTRRGIVQEWRMNYQPHVAIAFAIENRNLMNNGIIYNPGYSTIADSGLKVSDTDEIVGNLLLELKTDIMIDNIPEYYEIKALLGEDMPLYDDYKTYYLQASTTIGINPENPGNLEREVGAYKLDGLGSSYLLFIKPPDKWIDIAVIGAQESSYNDMTIAARLFSFSDTDPDSLYIVDNEFTQSVIQHDLEIAYVGKECLDNVDDLADLVDMLEDLERLENYNEEEQLEELENLKNSRNSKLLNDVNDSDDVEDLLDDIDDWLHDLDRLPERITVSSFSNTQEIQMLALLIVNLSDENDVPFLINIESGPTIRNYSTPLGPIYYYPPPPSWGMYPLSGFIGLYPGIIPPPFIATPINWGAFFP
ncbi:MAG: hypothetical protein ACMUIP_06090 [bacterium]